MRRAVWVNLLITAVLAAAAGLAYYAANLARRERALAEDTVRELAEEKVIGIESEILRSEQVVFAAVSADNLLQSQVILASAPVQSVLVLDTEGKVLPDGYVTKRSAEEGTSFRDFFLAEIVPDLRLLDLPVGIRGHHFATYAGRPYLFSYVRKAQRERDYFVVIETDLSYVVGSIFPQFFGFRSPRLYQVVDGAGDLVYGYGFGAAGVIEMPFAETMSDWRLRVAQRDSGAGAGADERFLAFFLIGAALAVIIAGLSVLVIAMRRERKANELKSEFISNVSHELKTPLSIISMFGELLALGRTKSGEQATEYADIIWRESVRLSRLIDNVLDFAKIERGADAYAFEPGDLGDVVARAVELSARRLTHADVEVRLNIEEGLPAVDLDANAMLLVFLNLVENAAKYASDGRYLDVDVAASEGGVVATLRDYGPGIPEGQHERIFERFYRAPEVRLKTVRGSGIGLALAQRVVLAHHGVVTAEIPKDGPGACFRVWIPAANRA